MLDTSRDDKAALTARIWELERRLEESRDALHAIRRGQVDAVIVSDTTGERQVYTLDNADRPYRALIEQIKEGAFTAGADGTILYCNARLAEMLGVPRERSIGRNLQSFAIAEDAATLSRLLGEATRSGCRTELTLRSPDGRLIVVNLSLNLLRRDDDVRLLCGIITDLTDQKHHLQEMAASNQRLREEIAARAQAEEELRHVQKMQAIGRLASGVAHDFNNILQSIVGGLELVLEEAADGTSARQFASIALKAAMRGSSLTHHLLSYARKQMLMPQLVELAPFLADLRTLLDRTLGPHIAIELSVDGTPSVLVDPGQLQTALLNLAINSAHSMSHGGTLGIAVRDAAEDQALVIITVTDTGVGMDAATLSQAVEPFFTTKGLEGTGLGLSMVQGFVEQSGGKFSIDSSPAGGTRVELRLPSGEPDAHDDALPIPTSRQPGRILLVDDTADVLVTTAAFLESAGFAVARASDARAALALLAGGERFDVIVTDYAMPGLNGASLIAESRIVGGALPAVLITGFAGVGEGETLPQRTMVLQKPFHRSALLDALRRIMDLDQLAPEPGGALARRGFVVPVEPRRAAR